MPGMVAFGRRWGIASDDLVLPGAFELFLRVIWFVVKTNPRLMVYARPLQMDGQSLWTFTRPNLSNSNALVHCRPSGGSEPSSCTACTKAASTAPAGGCFMATWWCCWSYSLWSSCRCVPSSTSVLKVRNPRLSGCITAQFVSKFLKTFPY